MNRSKIIYIIDDDKVYQFTASKALDKTSNSKKILTFYDGEEALTFLKEHAHTPDDVADVIFLDLNMPIMDGWQFLEEFKNIKPLLNKQITIFIVSSSNDETDTLRAKQIEDVTGYLVKPIHPKEFSKILDNL